jgi:hypothetical protein
LLSLRNPSGNLANPAHPGNAHAENAVAQRRLAHRLERLRRPADVAIVFVVPQERELAGDSDEPGPPGGRESGTYALLSFAHQDSVPLATVQLARGDRLGFQRNGDGCLVAVAGKQTFPVTDGAYGWAIVEKRPEQKGPFGQQSTEALDNFGKIVTPVFTVVLTVTLFAGALIVAGLAHGSCDGLSPNFGQSNP